MQQIEIPRFVDSLPQIFWWELDEFLVAAALFGVSIIIHMVVLGIVLAVFSVRIVRKFKTSTLPGQLLHLAYWYGLATLNEQYQDGLLREYYL